MNMNGGSQGSKRHWIPLYWSIVIQTWEVYRIDHQNRAKSKSLSLLN